MSSDKRDAERVAMLGHLQGEVMVFQPMVIKEVSLGGGLVETRLSASSQLASRSAADAGRRARSS